MILVSAFIVSQEGRTYTVEARAEGTPEPFVFQIEANSDTDAAMEAIRRVETFTSAAQSTAREN
jgi:hypothetical protein